MTTPESVAKPYSRNCEIKPGMTVPEGISRVAVGIEYHGARFRGFQKQRHDSNTVQGYLELALSEVANEPIELVCAGRTDSGVHATHQVVHFDTLAKRPAKAWTMGVNTKLPDAIAVRWAQPVPLSFHARFSAQSRTYRYIIQNTATRPGIFSGLFTWDKRRLDVAKMQAAALVLLGEHDFSSFRAAQCQARSPIRTLEKLVVRQQGSFLVIEVRANAFLHHMVRNIVGVLLAVAAGDKPVAWVGEVLAARDRRRASVTAPAAGLYLVQAQYPSHFQLPQLDPGPGFLNLPLV